MSNTFNIDDLIIASDKFQAVLDAIECLGKAEIALSTSMKGNCANELILLEEMKNVLINDRATVNGLKFIKATYIVWKQRIDDKIVELKSEEFPSEIIL